MTPVLYYNIAIFLAENLQTLADRLIGPFDIEAVVDPIGVKISDAIMNFQNSGYEVTGQVFNDCGTPRLEKRQVKRSSSNGKYYLKNLSTLKLQ